MESPILKRDLAKAEYKLQIAIQALEEIAAFQDPMDIAKNALKVINGPFINPATILELLNRIKLPITTEKILQARLEEIFINNKIPFRREYYLSEKDKPDFVIRNIVIEVKIKGGRRQIYEQCKRYCMHEEVKHLILITNKALGFPATINNVNCWVLNLGTAWL